MPCDDKDLFIRTKKVLDDGIKELRESLLEDNIDRAILDSNLNELQDRLHVWLAEIERKDNLKEGEE